MEETKNVQENVQEEEQKTNKVSAAEGEPVVTVIDTTDSGKGRYSWLKKGDVYEFTIVDEGLDTGFKVPMVSMIIGEVSSVKNNVVKLAAWAYTSEPDKIRPATDITVVSCADLTLKDWYKFMYARMKEVYYDDVMERTEEESEEYDLLKHNFAKHLVEDASMGRTSIVKHNDKLYVMPTPEQAVYNEYGGRKLNVVVKYSPDERVKTAFCEVTNIVRTMSGSLDIVDLSAIFGHDVVLDVASYEEICSTAFDAINEKETSDSSTIVSEVTDPVVKQHILKENKKTVTKYFEKAVDAASAIDAADERQYIIIVPKDDMKAEVILTDDPHSILHSRHLLGKDVILNGPYTNYSNVMDILLTSLCV